MENVLNYIESSNKEKKTLTLEFPAAVCEYIESTAALRNETPETYIERLVHIDVLEDELKMLKYKPYFH